MTATAALQIGHTVFIVLNVGGISVKTFGTVKSTAVGYCVETPSQGEVTFGDDNVDFVLAPAYDGDCAGVELKAV